MPKPLTVEDIDQIGFQQKEWAAQRVGWAVIALFLVAATASHGSTS
jgi:hypothetical protein